jgi:hypothetical protein
MGCYNDTIAELSSVELVASIKGRFRPVATLVGQLRAAAKSVFEALRPGRDVPATVSQLAQRIDFAPVQIESWKESTARAGAEQALSFVLSWYEGVDLNQLEYRRKGGLDNINLVALHQRACAITECADMDKFFFAGENAGGEGEDDEELEVSSFTDPFAKTPEDLSSKPALGMPEDTSFVLAARTLEGADSEPADTLDGP